MTPIDSGGYLLEALHHAINEIEQRQSEYAQEAIDSGDTSAAKLMSELRAQAAACGRAEKRLHMLRAGALKCIEHLRQE